MLDTIGLILLGAGTEPGRIAHGLAIERAGAAEATLAGGTRVPAAAAALAHGTAAHCRDYDDTFADSVVHPGSVVIPAALAAAEAVHAAPEDFAAAVIAGYEVAARVGAVSGRMLHAHGLHSTGVVGPIAAAAAAARAMRLDGERSTWAMGLAASMSGGLMAFTLDGAWSKWLHAGWSAHGGVIAAEMAARGFRGPERILDGPSDLYVAFAHGESVRRECVTEELGARWSGLNADFKYYPCAHVTQPFIDAALALAGGHGLRGADIESVECVIAPWAAAVVCEPREARLRVNSEAEAIASLPYQVACALFDGKVGLVTLTEARRGNAEIADLTRRVSHRSDPALGRGFEGSIRVSTRDGRAFERRAGAAPPDSHKLRTKFLDTAAVLGADNAATAADLLLAGDGTDYRQAAALLAAARV